MKHSFILHFKTASIDKQRHSNTLISNQTMFDSSLVIMDFKALGCQRGDWLNKGYAAVYAPDQEHIWFSLIDKIRRKWNFLLCKEEKKISLDLRTIIWSTVLNGNVACLANINKTKDFTALYRILLPDIKVLIQDIMSSLSST